MNEDAERVHAFLRRVTLLRGPYVYIYPVRRAAVPWWCCADFARIFEKLDLSPDLTWSTPEVQRRTKLRLDFLAGLNEGPALIVEAASVYTAAVYLLDYLKKGEPRPPLRAVRDLRKEAETMLSHVNDMALYNWEE